MQEQDNWVRVQITGWIWKESLTNVRPDALKGDYRALHILVKTRAEAEDILKQIKTGKDFSELAKSKSISPSASKGGDLGYFNKGDFPANIENAILKLQVNSTSDIVETKFGFNIFKRLK
ncbi:peptidyl-prolyl cis-trans isomerase [candidate division KSB1 bacterium]|nr:peptidyl-prolyl cis-trans isomerase [candidate division KSB1 bacterium]